MTLTATAVGAAVAVGTMVKVGSGSGVGAGPVQAITASRSTAMVNSVCRANINLSLWRRALCLEGNAHGLFVDLDFWITAY